MIERVDNMRLVNSGNVIATTYKKLRTACVVTTSVMMKACASATTQEEEYSGFLSDYSQLREVVGTDETPVLKWVNSELKERSYSKFMIDPVVVYSASQPDPSSQ